MWGIGEGFGTRVGDWEFGGMHTGARLVAFPGLLGHSFLQG